MDSNESGAPITRERPIAPGTGDHGPRPSEIGNARQDGVRSPLPPSDDRAGTEFRQSESGPRLATLPPIPDVVTLLKALRQRWLIGLTLGLASAVLAAMVTWYLLPEVRSQSTAYALLYIASSERKIAFSLPTSNNSEFPTYRRMQAEWIKTKPVLQAALAQPQVAALASVRSQVNPAVWLERDVKVDFPGEAEMLRISMSGEKPADLATLVNGVTRAYLQEIVQKESTQKRDMLAEYQRIFQETEKTLRAKRDELRRVAGNLGTADASALNLQQQLALEFYNTLRKHDAQVSLDLMVAEVQAKVGHDIGAFAGVKVPASAVEERVDQDSLIKKHRQEMGRLEDVIRRYSSYSAYGDQDPAVVRYRKALQDAQAEERRRRSELRPAIAQRLADEQRESQGLSLEGIKAQIALLTEQQRSLRKKLDAQFQEVKKFLGTSSLELDSIQMEIELKERIANHIGLQLEALRIEVQSPARVLLVQEAEEPAPQDPNRHSKAVALAGLTTFVFVGFCTGWWEFRSRRIRGAEDLTRGLNLRLLGTIPALPPSVMHDPLGLAESGDLRSWHQLTEAVDAIRMMLSSELRSKPSQVVMVTSALESEGKTTLASQLAASLARAGKATLLVDGDLLQPAVHQMMDVPLVPGLSEILRGEIEPVQGVRPLSLEGLWVLSAGKWDRRVHAAMTGAALPRMFNQLRAGYDFVIIDASPVLPVAQALLLGQHADAVILSVLRDVSHAPRVYAAYQRLAALGIRVLGAVLNKATAADNLDVFQRDSAMQHVASAG